MNRTALIVSVVFGVAIIGLIIYFAYNQDQRFRWYPTYSDTGEEPYDLAMLRRQLEKSYSLKSIQKNLIEELPLDGAAGSSYVFIGDYPYYTEAQADHLMEYLRRGGRVFIAANRLPDSLIQNLIYGDQCSPFGDFWRGTLGNIYKETVRASFTHPELNTRFYEFAYTNNFAFWGHNWCFIPKERICDEAKYPMATLGQLRDPEQGTHPNFVRMQVESGRVFFHTNPILFTNYYFVNAQGFEYLTKVFAHLDGERIYWDRKSSVPENPSLFNRRPENNLSAQRNPMEYVYSQPALRMAWYLMLVLGLLYVLFRAKRRQRIIPIIEPNRNTSLEFVQTISRLYFQQQDHKSILLKQMQQFLSHLRRRYHIVVRTIDEPLLERLAVRTSVSKDILRPIFDEYERISKALEDREVRVAGSTLNRFYALIERFYQAEAQRAEALRAAEKR